MRARTRTAAAPDSAIGVDHELLGNRLADVGGGGKGSDPYHNVEHPVLLDGEAVHVPAVHVAGEAVLDRGVGGQVRGQPVDDPPPAALLGGADLVVHGAPALPHRVEDPPAPGPPAARAVAAQ